MHAFGAWLANSAAKNHHSGTWWRDEIVRNINLFKASNGEEIHGYLWQSLRLLAYDTGTLQGKRKLNPDQATATRHAHEVCAPMWWLSPQSMNDVRHCRTLKHDTEPPHAPPRTDHSVTELSVTLSTPRTQCHSRHPLWGRRTSCEPCLCV
jgi:hypothetical protein